jgi:fermentation-respiration switch protein FrsA (DUF1100 family)
LGQIKTSGRVLPHNLTQTIWPADSRRAMWGTVIQKHEITPDCLSPRKDIAMREDVAFASDGATLKGWLYRPQRPVGLRPAIVMAHGFSATKEMFLDDFAEVFAAAGFAVLVYDHRNLGASSGEPRGEIDPVAQIRGYRDAITWLQHCQGIDPDRIGVWGSSYSGGHVMVLGATDSRVKCVVAQVPALDAYRSFIQSGRDMLDAFRTLFNADRAARYRSEAPAMIPVIPAEAGGFGALTTQDSIDFFKLCETRASNWRNQVTLRSLEYLTEYAPAFYLPRIAPTPLMMVVALKDSLIPSDMALEAFATAGEPKKLLTLDCGHFAPYTGDTFRTVSAAQCAWFCTYLKP